MIDKRFSSENFRQKGLDSPEARELADLLAEEIHQEIDEVVQRKLTNIIECLNGMGHNLKLYEPPILGYIQYRDDTEVVDEIENADEYECFLRVAVDTIITTGYAHLYKWNS